MIQSCNVVVTSDAYSSNAAYKAESETELHGLTVLLSFLLLVHSLQTSVWSTDELSVFELISLLQN